MKNSISIIKILLALLSLSFLITPSFADDTISKQKLALIKVLLKQTHQSTQDISQQLTDSYQQQVTAILKQSHPDISSATMIKINKAIATGVKQQLIKPHSFFQRISPIYDSAFTQAELEKIIAFNKTELGKKLLKTMPLIDKQHRDVYEELALDLAPDINDRVLSIIELTKTP